jgi:hypothetical protein
MGRSDPRIEIFAMISKRRNPPFPKPKVPKAANNNLR